MNSATVEEILRAGGYDDIAIGIIVHGKNKPNWHDYMRQRGYSEETITAVAKYGGTLEPEADE